MVPMRLPAEVEERLDALAQASGRSAIDVVLTAILDYLQRHGTIGIGLRLLSPWLELCASQWGWGPPKPPKRLMTPAAPSSERESVHVFAA